MRTESRIILSGLSEDVADKLVAVIRAVAKKEQKRGVKVELDHPDPPELLEDEFLEVDAALGALEEIVSSSGGDWSGATKKSQILTDVKKMRRLEQMIKKGLDRFVYMVDKLEVAAQKL